MIDTLFLLVTVLWRELMQASIGRNLFSYYESLQGSHSISKHVVFLYCQT
jgi:hypothetical protein